MAEPKDPTLDIYEMLDRSGLVTGNILTKRESMEKIVTGIRLKLVTELKKYIEERDKTYGKVE